MKYKFQLFISLSVYTTPVTILLKKNTIPGKNLCVKGLNEVKKLKGFIFLDYSDQVRYGMAR